MEDNIAVPENKIYPGLYLKRIIDEIDDIYDPSSMDKLMEYVDEIQAEDDNFIELLTMRCQNAVIYWEQPWYQQINKLTTYTPKPRDVPSEDDYRTDPISTCEHELIVKNWNKFKKKYRLPDQIISLVRWRDKAKYSPQKEARLYAVAYLCRGLKRTKYQVYFHISAYFGGYKTGYYTDIEQKLIDICYYHKPKLMAIVMSILLGRRKRGVYKRIGLLTNGKPLKKRLKWNLALASKFLNHLLEHTGLTLEELKNKKIDIHIWRKLEKDMDQSSPYLYHFWYCYLHVQLFVPCDVKLHKLKKRLFKKIKERSESCKYKVWRDIRWKDLLEDFPDGFTHLFIYRVCYLFIQKLKGYRKMPLEQVLDYALECIKKQHGKKQNKRLRKLRVREDGQLEVVKTIACSRYPHTPSRRNMGSAVLSYTITSQFEDNTNKE